jgi:hypothetical protein
MDEVLKPCPFCGSPPMPDYCSTTDGPAYSFHCHAKDCPAWPNVQGETEAEAIAAWNTRADAAPTPKADEVEAVGFAMWKAEADRAAPNVGKNRAIENYRYDLDPTSRAKWDQIAQAAIAALDAARGDQVARLIAHMKTIEPDEETAGCPATWADFLQILEAEAEAWEPFNG